MNQSSFEASATPQDPRVEIASMMHEASSMGANDSELKELQELIAQLNGVGANDPELVHTALTRARSIVDSKQAYH